MSEQIIKELWDFRQTKIPEKLLELKVSQSAVEARLTAAAERFLTIEPVSDGIRRGDIAALELTDGEASRRMQINVGLGFAGEALEESLLGLSAGAEVSAEGVSGRVVSVKRRRLPVLTDALVSRLGLEGVSTVDQYRTYVQEQEARRVQAGKSQALCEVVTKAVLEHSVFAEIGEDNPDYRLIYQGTKSQLEAMAAERGVSLEEALAKAMKLEGESAEACWEALHSQCADMVRRTALGQAAARQDGVSYTREDVLRQYREAGMESPGEEQLAAGCMQLYIRYFQQKIAEYYSGQFRKVLVP